MEREGREERGRGEMRRRRGRGIIVGGITLFLLFGCNNGLAELEKRNSFYESVIKIGQGFQEVFGNFGNAMGDALGFNAVKSDSKKNDVGKHFDKIKNGLTETKNKLNELSGKISETKNADGSAIKVVEGAIKSASDVFDRLIGELDKLSGVTKDGSEIGHNDHSSGAAGANETDVNTVIKSVKEIIEVAGKSGVEIKPGDAGALVNHGSDTAGTALAQTTATGQGAAAKLAAEVSKADPWAIIDKVKGAKTDGGSLSGATNGAGALATKTGINGAVGSKTNADLAAAVALKAMIKGGKFSAASQDADIVKAAASSAVNKLLGILDVIISKAVNLELAKIKDAVKGIQYSETSRTEATESGTGTKK